MEPVVGRTPAQIVMWGVGLTDSDVDLTELYKAWASRAEKVEIINPSPDVAQRVRALASCDVVHFSSVEEWGQRRC